MKSLILILHGPMQSWGEIATTRGTRSTRPHPTRSGLIGILAAAQGHPRDADLTWATPLIVTVRVDRAGEHAIDFQTINGGYTGDRRMRLTNGGVRPDPIISDKHYLADATFMAAITGPDELIEHLATATRNPRWPLFLGRRAHIPAVPIHVGVMTHTNIHFTGQEAAWHALSDMIPLYRASLGRETVIPIYTDSPDPSRARHQIYDVPLTFETHHRNYGSRGVAVNDVTFTPDQHAGTGHAGYDKVYHAVNGGTGTAKPEPQLTNDKNVEQE